MNTRKLWRALCATILCVALLCGMAVAEDDITLEIDATNTAEEDVTVELDGDLEATVEDSTDLNLDLSLDDGLALIEIAPEAIDGEPVALTNEGEGEETRTNVPLKVTYSGPALTKTYDLTRNAFVRTSSGGYAYAVTAPMASDFSVEPANDGDREFFDAHRDVRIRVTSIKSVEQFSDSNVGDYTLKFTFGLEGSDAQYYTAQSVSVPAKIEKKNKKVTGYQIAYSLTKDFSIWEDKIVRDPKKTGVTIKSLKSKTTYYVRIRTYKRLNGRRHWSPWSDSMKVKTK